jgi:hypothetical protein
MYFTTSKMSDVFSKVSLDMSLPDEHIFFASQYAIFLGIDIVYLYLCWFQMRQFCT